MSQCPLRYPSQEGAEHPFPFYAWARAEQPVYQIPGLPYYFLTKYEDLVYATEHPEIFSSVGRNLGTTVEAQPKTASGIEIRTMIESDAPDHPTHRSFAFQLLNPKALREYRPMILELVEQLIDSFIDQGEVEFVSAFANKLPALVTARMAGFPDSLLTDLHAWGQIEGSGAPFLPPEKYAEHLRVRDSMVDYVRSAIEARAVDPPDDGIGKLIKLQVERDGEFSLPYVRAQAGVLLAGGTTTTAHMLGMGLLLLINHPDVMRRVVDDKTLIRPFLDEALRVESPVQWVPRRVARDVELGGVKIPAGSHILLGWGSANRDETVFENPDAFDIDREGPNKHVSFGHGPHACLGLPLARLELTIAFERLLTRLTDIRLALGAEPRHIDSPSFRGLRSLPITFKRAP